MIDMFGCFRRYVRLFPSVRNIVRCYATIISTRSAVLTGTAAACVLGIPFLGNTSNLKTIGALSVGWACVVYRPGVAGV